MITVARINDAKFTERIRVEGKSDLVSLGRALIGDPELPNKATQGRIKDMIFSLP